LKQLFYANSSEYTNVFMELETTVYSRR